jgi:hypothetical protein
MRKSLFFIIAGVVVLVLGGSALFFWRHRGPTEISSPEEPRQERQLPVTPPSADEMPYETFTAADGHLSFEYPSAWTRTEIQNLETVLPREFIDKYQLAMPLILSDPRGAQTVLSTYRFDKGMDLNAVMDALAAELVNLGQPYNEVSRGTVGDSLVVDSTVETQGVTVRVRDVLFLFPGETDDPKNTVYNLSFSTRQESWNDYKEIFAHVQSSAQLSF